MRQSYHLGVRTYRDREAVVLYIDLEDESRRDERARGTTDGKIASRLIAYTYDGKLPPILDKLSTILEECRREVTRHVARSSRAKPTICRALKAKPCRSIAVPSPRCNVEPLHIESASSSGLEGEKKDDGVCIPDIGALTALLAGSYLSEMARRFSNFINSDTCTRARGSY